ncbi:hypothetical protein Tco_1138657, partial [Tanacetum coccineum]
ADASPTALSPGYIVDSNPKDESKDGPTNYPADGGDDDDDSSRDHTNEEEESSEKVEEEEKHLASTESTAISLAVGHVPSAEETEPFETDESTATPPPLAYHTTSPTYGQAPLGYRAAGMRATSPPTYHPLPLTSPPLPPPSSPLLPPVDSRKEVPKADLPPRKRLCLTAPIPRFKVGESSTVAATRQPGLWAARTNDYGFVDMVDDATRRHVPREVGYGITDTWDELVDAIQEGAPTTLKRVNARVTELAETHERDIQDFYDHLEDAQDSRARLSNRVDILLEDRQFHQQTFMLMEDDALVSQEAWAQAMGCSAAVHYGLQAYRAHTQTQDLRISCRRH